jgi:hypothetical protein
VELDTQLTDNIAVRKPSGLLCPIVNSSLCSKLNLALEVNYSEHPTLTGASKKAVSRLMVDAGQAAAWYQDRVFRNLTCKCVQVDEIWAFVYAKQKNVEPAC